MKPLLIVETNFVVQTVTRRDGEAQTSAVDILLEKVRAGELELAIPAFSLIEARFVLRQGEKRRNRLSNSLATEEAELRRSPLSGQAAQDLAAFRGSLVAIRADEGVAYDEFYELALSTATVIDHDRDVLSDAVTDQHGRPLSLADSVVFHSVLRHMRSRPPDGSPAIFLNYNKADFDQESVTSRLKRADCKVVFDARAALASLARGV